MRVLTICPVKGNPELAKKMVRSYNDTIAADNTIVLACDIGDETLSGYKEIRTANKMFCKAGSTITECINSVFLQHPDYDFYHITNDDCVYETEGWDAKFIALAEEYGNGVYYGNDCLQGKNLCTFPFISGDIVRAVGWLQLPTLNRYAGDVVWKLIGDICNCRYYMGGVIIRHNWQGCADEDMNKEDMKRFAEWLPHSHKDVYKVKNVL